MMKNSVKTFIEFGFHPIEFNCIELARRPDWSGLLIDGTTRQVEDARALWPSRIETTPETRSLIRLSDNGNGTESSYVRLSSDRRPRSLGRTPSAFNPLRTLTGS